MKSTVSILISFVIALSFVFQGTTQAQCTKVLKSRTGTVYAAGPAKTTLRPTSNSITVKVNKRGGRAQTIVNIYVNNVRKKFINFNNGNYSSTKTAVITGVRNKNVRIDIVNQSVGNKFEYKLTVTGEAPASLGKLSGNLVGQTQKTKTFDKSCKNNVRITVKRKSGQARASLVIKKNGRVVQNFLFNNNTQNFSKSFPNSKDARYTVELRNLSVGNRFGYEMSATQSN
ncbi:MAG: hypothetical protein AAFY71_21375 [Bacteroidota bacterium]